jgi:hypothetical protein
VFRSDGVGELGIYEVLATERRSVSIRAHGLPRPPPEFELPAPEALPSPEFQWPDVTLPVHGFALFLTGAEGIEWPNRTIAVFEGEVNPGLRTLVVSARALVPAQSATV